MTVIENLSKNGTDPESFVVSTDRLLEAAVLEGDPNLAIDVVRRTARLAGVDTQTALNFVVGRMSRQLEKAIKIEESRNSG